MKVLIVDDDQTMVDVIQQNIDWTALGIDEVFTAYNINTAMTIIEEHPVDVVISDIEMPKGSGLDLLQWFREEGQEGEFLLLTSHERFDYATYAVRLHASEYLLKPFDPVMMEATLQKIVAKRKADMAQRENANQGEWLASNMRQVRLSFFRHRLESAESLSESQIAAELRGLDLPQNPNHPYTLLVSRVTDTDRDIETIRQELFDFILTNIHSEMLCGSADEGNVLLFKEAGQTILVSVVDTTDREELQERCKKLLERFGQLFKATLTVCMAPGTEIRSFATTFATCKESLHQYVSGYGSCFFLDAVPSDQGVEGTLLPITEMVGLLQKNDKYGFLSLVKNGIADRERTGALTGELLSRLYQELLQVVYTVLGEAGISVSELFDDDLNALSKKAEASTMGMIRFCNYLVERSIAVMQASTQKDTLADKVDRHIKKNYRKDITTGDIAEEFHMNGEYLNKSYRKERGVGIKDALNEYRIEESKKLLLRTDEAISNIATEVGFDNFTYFSTLFKKYVGMSPSQFRKTESGV